jgi:macrodomain Ter protein organizer (MatP/YcbG family)
MATKQAKYKSVALPSEYGQKLRALAGKMGCTMGACVGMLVEKATRERAKRGRKA